MSKNIGNEWWTSPTESIETGNLIMVTGKDPVAVMTGVYTGDGRRDWVFYARNTHTFEKRFNVALASFDLLPISIHAEPDPDWEEYDEMCQASEIVPEE